MTAWTLWRLRLAWDRHRLRRLQYRHDTFGNVSDVAIFGALRRVHQREMCEPTVGEW